MQAHLFRVSFFHDADTLLWFAMSLRFLIGGHAPLLGMALVHYAQTLLQLPLLLLLGHFSYVFDVVLCIRIFYDFLLLIFFDSLSAMAAASLSISPSFSFNAVLSRSSNWAFSVSFISPNTFWQCEQTESVVVGKACLIDAIALACLYLAHARCRVANSTRRFAKSSSFWPSWRLRASFVPVSLAFKA